MSVLRRINRVKTFFLFFAIFWCFYSSGFAEMQFVNRLSGGVVIDGQVYTQSEDDLQIWFPIIYEADATLIRCQRQTMLIDTGTSRDYEALVSMLDRAGIDKVDRVFITHPHHDHLGSVNQLLQHDRIGELHVCHVQRQNKQSTMLYSNAQKAGVPVVMHMPGDVMEVGGAKLELWMLNSPRSDLNERSGVLKLTYGDFSMLMLADLHDYGLRMLLQEKGEWLRSTVLRYPHHGAEALPQGFADMVSPKLIVITGAQNQRMGKRYAESLGIPVVYTDQHIIKISTNNLMLVAEPVMDE